MEKLESKNCVVCGDVIDTATEKKLTKQELLDKLLATKISIDRDSDWFRHKRCVFMHTHSCIKFKIYGKVQEMIRDGKSKKELLEEINWNQYKSSVFENCFEKGMQSIGEMYYATNAAWYELEQLVVSAEDF